MLVVFARKAYLDKIYKPSPYGVEVPESFRDRLPSGAVIIDEAPPVPLKESPKQVALSQLSKNKKSVTKAETFSEMSKQDQLDLEDL